MEVARLTAKIDADSKEGEAGLHRFHGLLEKSSGAMGGMLKVAGGFAIGTTVMKGLSMLGNFLEDSVKAGMDANLVQAQLAAGLKSTGGASGQTMESLDALSTKIMNMSGIQDDAVKASESMLLTFTNISSKTFPAATQAVSDLATKMNNGIIPSAQQMEQASIQLGKALNDPLHGITALQRVGVTFDAQQKQQIKTMMAAGDTAGAQGVILKEMNKEFGGAAAAAGQANGGLAILGAQFDSMKVQIGQAIIPILVQLLTAIHPLVDWLGAHLPAALKVVEGFIKANVLPIMSKLEAFIGKNILPVLEKFGKFILSHVVPALGQLVKWGEKHVLPVLETLVSVFVSDLLPAQEQIQASIMNNLVPALEKLWTKLEPILIPALQLVGWIMQNVVGPALGFVIGLVSDLIDVLANLLGKVGDVLGKLGDFKDLVGKGLGGLGNMLGLGGHAEGTQFHQGGAFLGAEQGPELLLKPGVYSAPRGSTVLNAQETQRAMSSGGGGGGVTVNIYPQKADLDASDLTAHLRRYALLANTGGGY